MAKQLYGESGLSEKEALKLLAPQPEVSARGTSEYSGGTSIYVNASFSSGSRSRVDRVVIHTTQGANYPVVYGAGGGANYEVSRDGLVNQQVHEKDIAWHAGDWPYNLRSIGIEHVGYVTQYYPDAQVRASARLAAYLCRKYGLKPTRDYFVPHSQVNPSQRTDPGPYWDWTKYFRYVNEALGGKSPAPVKEESYRLRKYNFLHALPEHQKIAKAAAEAINAALVAKGKDKLATYGGGTPGKIAYATGKSADAKAGTVVSYLIGAKALEYVSPKVTVIGGPDESDIVSTYRVYPKLGSADALEKFLAPIEKDEGISFIADYRKRLPKAPAR